MSERKCRECGCTDLDCSQCIVRTGLPCCWVEEDLCSACEQLGPPERVRAKGVRRGKR